MELQYPDYLPGIGAQDLQEDGYSREFLDYNRIDSDPIASSYTHNPNHILKSDHQSAGIESPGYNCNPASEVKIPAIPSNPGISACKPPGLRQSSPVTSTTDTEQENDPKDVWPSTTRVRTVFSEKQKRILMQRFQRQKYISPQERSELANALGLNCKQVKTWYQNRRMKLKRRQYIRPPATSWNQSNFNPISSQTLTLTHELTPGLMKSHFISYEQQSMLSSGQAVPFRKHRTSFACPIVEVFQSSPIHGGPQCSSASSYFQSLPPTDCPDPGFGGFHKEHLAIPHARSLSFRNQIPRSGMGYPAVEILRSSSVEKDMQCIATSASFPPSEGDHISPSFNIQTVGREAIASSQDIQIHPNNWCPMQGDGSSPGYISLAPVFDAYGVQQSGSADLFNEGYPMTLSGTF